MKDVIAIHVPGIPRAKGSKRHVGHGVMIESSQFIKPWMASMSFKAGSVMQGREVLAGPLIVTCAFFFPRPAYHYGTGRNAGALKASAPHWHTSAPDVDKLLRGVLDALTGIVFKDDAQVCQATGLKVYAGEGLNSPPGVWIYVSRPTSVRLPDVGQTEGMVAQEA